MDVQLFLGALGKRWWALLSSATFTILGLYALATNKTSSWVVWASFVAAVAMLLVASALAWNDEHKRTLILGGEIEKLKRVPAQFAITPYELRSSGSMHRDIFLHAAVELLTPIELEVDRYSVELSLNGVIETPEVRSVAGQWRLHDGSPSTPRSQPMPPLPMSLRSGHPAEGWIHFVTTRNEYELESSRMTLFVHTSRGDGHEVIPCGRGCRLSSSQNFIMPDLGSES